MSSTIRVLLIDDEADSLLPSLAQNLEPLGFAFVKEANAEYAIPSIRQYKPDVILLDLHFPGDENRMDGCTTGGALLTTVRREFHDMPVVVFTTRLDDADIPLESFEEQPHRRCAKPDFATGRAWASALADTLRGAIEAVKLAEAPATEDFGFVVGNTREMREVAAQVRIAARNTLNVLIYGETGTGKQRVANAIHNLSGREGRFEQVNCSGIHEETLEAQLFGHERGAFTGAQKSTPGLFELADGGTLFLDEIQSMPMSLQNKLMVVIEQSRVRRMGATEDRNIDVRVMVATNHSLSDLVANGVLREDLAYRFSVFLISLPPMRNRMADLPEFFDIFMDRAARLNNKHVSKFLRPETLAKLASHHWPGNIRELENTIARAVANTTSTVLLPEDIVFVDIASAKGKASPNPPNVPRNGAKYTDGRENAYTETAILSQHSSITEEPGQESNPAVLCLTDQLEALPLAERYGFLRDQRDKEMRSRILAEFVCRLCKRSGRKVQHKTLAKELDPIVNGQKDYERIRQLVNGCLKLTELECNRQAK